jgi:hypothetical protein
MNSEEVKVGFRAFGVLLKPRDLEVLSFEYFSLNIDPLNLFSRFLFFISADQHHVLVYTVSQNDTLLAL